MNMYEVAQAMVAPGKGILAADESHATCGKRFAGIGVESSEETRAGYRGMMVTADGLEEHVAGIILFDETLRQKTTDGTPFVQILQEKGVMPGIKVDTGAKNLALHDGEKITEGLDGLRDRLAEYKELGATFAKWRAVITIGQGIPSVACYTANAHALARYAALCQEAGIVPMVEPEILMDGDHDIDTCYDVTERMLTMLFDELMEQGVDPKGTILKVSMVLSGKNAASRAGVEEVADRTVECLKANVPEELAGVVFLSGGQSEVEATAHLDAMNKRHPNLPWPLSFSYGRAIQAPALITWAGKEANVPAAQAELLKRAKMNGLAAKGEWSQDLED